MASIIGKRYGNAIFELAEDGDWVSVLEEEIEVIKVALTNDDLMIFLTHPNVSLTDKVSVIEKSLKGKVRDELVGFFCLLVKKGRCEYFSDVFEQIHINIDKYNGKAKAYVTSAYELSDTEKKNLVKKLSDMTKNEIVAIYKIDESLIGGLVIRIGDKVVDSSIKGSLNAMKKSLLENKTA